MLKLFQKFFSQELDKIVFLQQFKERLNSYSVEQLDTLSTQIANLYQNRRFAENVYQELISLVQQKRLQRQNHEFDSTVIRPTVNVNSTFSSDVSDGTVYREYDDSASSYSQSHANLSSNSNYSAHSQHSSRTPITTSKTYPKILSHRYQIEHSLGEGGMGTVYKATDLTIKNAQIHHPYVAIKLMKENFKDNDDAQMTLAREFTKTSQLRHDNIVAVHSFEKDGDNIYIVMEYLEGMPLRKYINEYAQQLDFKQLFVIVAQLASALDYAHKKDIIHSDFKPGNVFVTKRDQVKILDFGIARILNTKQNLGETIFNQEKDLEQRFRGLSPRYASLEMFDEYREEADPRDDIYALACVAYELFTGGRHPFNKVPANIAYKNDLKPTPINGFSEAQWQGMLKGLAFKREDRTTSALQFLEDITPRPELTSEPKEKSKPKKRRSVLGGRYQLIEVIGRGGMGTVYKALDLTIQDADVHNPYVAIKLLNKNFKDDPDAYMTLAREFTKTKTLRHDNIVGVHNFERDGDDIYIVMEYLEGQTLKQYIKDNPTGVEASIALSIVLELVNALDYSHQKGMVHLDFKPGNVFLTDEHEVKVLDFGISRLLNIKDELSETCYNREKQLAERFSGITLRYASSEMIHELEPDPRDDIYALACVTYELLTGKHPFAGLSADVACERDLTPEFVQTLSQRQWRGLLHGLAFFREDRTTDAQKFWQEIQAYDPEKDNHTNNRRTYLLFASIVLFAVIVAGTAWWGWQYYQFRQVATEIEQNNALSIASMQQKINALPKKQHQALYRNLQAKIATIVNQDSRQIEPFLNEIKQLPDVWQAPFYKILQSKLSELILAQESLLIDYRPDNLQYLEHLLGVVDKLPRAMRDNIYYNQKISDVIIDFYKQKSLEYVDVETKLYDLSKINQVLKTPLALYYDSKTLSDFLEELKQKKQKVVRQLRQDLQQLLAKNQVIIPSSQKTVIAVTESLKLAGEQQIIWQDDILLKRYIKQIQRLLAHDQFADAEILLVAAIKIFPQQSDLIALQHKAKLAENKFKTSRKKQAKQTKQLRQKFVRTKSKDLPQGTDKQKNTVELSEKIKTKQLEQLFAEKQNQLDDLYQKVKQAIAKNYLSTPEKQSAFYYLNQMRAIDPNDSRISQAVTIIVKRYINLANRKIKQQNLQSANTLLERAENFDMENHWQQQIALVRQKIEQINQQQQQAKEQRKLEQARQWELEQQRQQQAEAKVKQRELEQQRQQAKAKERGLEQQRQQQAKAKQQELAQQRQQEKIKPKPQRQLETTCHSNLIGSGRECYDILLDGSKGPKLVLIPASENLPAYAIGRYEVSIAEYQQFCLKTKQCRARAGNKNLPLTHIPYTTIKKYAQWLSEQTGFIYRLPQASEWLHAATDTVKNPNCVYKQSGRILKGGTLLSVKSGKKNANKWGLVNYVGNVQELVENNGKLFVRGGHYQTKYVECQVNFVKTHHGRADKYTGFRWLRQLKSE